MDTCAGYKCSGSAAPLTAHDTCRDHSSHLVNGSVPGVTRHIVSRGGRHAATLFSLLLCAQYGLLDAVSSVCAALNHLAAQWSSSNHDAIADKHLSHRQQYRTIAGHCICNSIRAASHVSQRSQWQPFSNPFRCDLNPTPSTHLSVRALIHGCRVAHQSHCLASPDRC